MHVISLIWSNSKYYCTPPRIIVFLREFCNFLIEIVSREYTNNNTIRIANQHTGTEFQTSAYLSPDELLKGELDESLERVKVAIATIEEFYATYDMYKAKIHTYFEVCAFLLVLGRNVICDNHYFQDERTAKKWEFAPELVFSRMTLFLDRLHTVQVWYLQFIALSVVWGCQP